MSQEEQHAADELDQVIAARQSGRVLHPAGTALAADADFAGRLLESARAARLDPEFSALLESELSRQHPQTQAAAMPSLAARWQALLASFGMRLSRSGSFAVALTVVIALLSFVVFRMMQSAPASSSAAATSAPFVAAVTAVASPSPLAPTAPPATPSPIPSAVSPLPSPTSVPAVVVQAPSLTPAPTRPAAAPSRVAPLAPSATPKPTAVPALISRVKIVMLDVNGGGSGKTVGCGDTLVFVDRDIAPTAAPLSAAIREQLSIHDQPFGPTSLYNALYNSNLTLVSASIANGHATINLTGTIRTGGVCDIPRVEAQIEETALQFSTVTSVTAYVNGVELHQSLSQK